MPTSLRRRASCLPSSGSRSPSMAISPLSIDSRRLIVRQSVDLPEPDGPMTTTTSPRAISRSMSCSTCSSPNHLLTPDSRTRGSPFGRLVTWGTLWGRGVTGRSGPSRRRNGSAPDRREFPIGTTVRQRSRRGGRSCAPYPRRRHGNPAGGTRAHLPRAHVRVPDERARLRAPVRPAGAGGLHAPRRRGTTPTSSSSTPARSGRTPTTASTATSATCGRSRTRGPACRSPSAAAWRRRTAARSSAAPRGSTSSSARTTSARCRPCSTAPGTTPRRRWRSWSPSRSSRRRCRPSATPPTRAGCRSASGCNNTCTFCIVPSLRGTEKDRRPGEILAEVQALVDQGVLEVTLLGQNVNAYGVEFRDRGAFADLLRATGAHRGPGAGAVHQPAPARVHRRRHRRDGRDAGGLPPAAHAAAVGVRRRAAPDAPRLPAGALPRDHRPRPGRDARRRDHHRHHRGLPRRDRGGLPADPRRRPPGAVRQRLHVPVLQAPRDPGRGDGRPAAQGRRPGAVPAADRAAGRDQLGRRTRRSSAGGSSCSSPRGRAARTPRPAGSPAGPATAGWCTSRRPTASGPATSSRPS